MSTVSTTAQAALALLAQESINFAQADKASSTLIQYESSWKKFTLFCQTFGLTAVPAEVRTVAVFLTSLAKEGKTMNTINVHLAALKYFNQRNGHTIDLNNPVLSAVLNGIRRVVGTKTNGSDAVLPEDLRKMVDVCDNTSTGVRNKSILLLGFCGAFRRSELINLTFDHLSFVNEGVLVNLEKSKTDQTSNGSTIAIPFASDINLCPIMILKKLKFYMKSGHLFRRIRKNGLIGNEAISDVSMWRIVTEIAEQAGLSGKITPHSLRHGFCTSAANNGARVDKIAKHARHSNIQTTMRYIHDAKKFEDNAANGLI